MTSWRYIARRALTKEFLNWDLPLTTEGPSWALSGPGSLTGTIAPEIGQLVATDGRLLLEEWGTLLYAEADGEIRWGGIVQSSKFDGAKWTVGAFGDSSYLSGIPYGKEYRGVQVDPADVVREMWAHAQSFADSDLGVTVTGSTSVRVGTDSDEKAAVAAAAASKAKAAHDAEKNKLAALKTALADARKAQTAASANRTAKNKEVTAARKVRTASKRDYTSKYRALINRRKQLDAAIKKGTAAEITAARAALADAQRDHDAAESLTLTHEAILQARLRELAALDVIVNQKKAAVAAQVKVVDAQSAVVDKANDVLDKAKDVKSAADDVARDDGGAHKILWWEAPDCGKEIDDLAQETPFDYAERHYWAGDDIKHEVQIFYPRAGRRRTDLSFVQGVNISNVVTPERDGAAYANEVLGLGAGEGSGSLRRTTALRDGRLRRVGVLSAKDISKASRLDAQIRGQLERSALGLQIDSIEVTNHPNAPIGSWSLGDDILVEASLPWLGEIAVWHRITGWGLLGENRARLDLARSDSFSYGG